VNTAVVGTYTIEYRKIDSSGNISNIVTRTITVTPVPDTTAPVVTLSGVTPLYVEYGSGYTDPGASWTDNFDGSGSTLTGSWSQTGSFVLSGSVNTGALGTYTLQYQKIDNAGNISTGATRTVIVRDTTAPVATLIGSGSITVNF
jgi:Domain of unknown function (DUF5011)